ncbi:hypothetical protein Purlil1_14400 [Purpureocillium lilacinum]|uniref:Adenylate kinase n=1 Tax=Purpureocillium lilacinum TaxID=33203 RepID=A0ABR0BBD2_PURLI|nr:hypothetical protein Purlil1_14400 [Purpureocillium lilacinum]
MFDDAQGVLQRWNAWECSSRKHKFIFVIGGPGVGKGTQCARAASALEATHISAGELLRAEQARPNSRFQAFLAKSFALSIPVPPLLLMEILRSAIQDQPHDVVFLDGFPLTEQQLEEFEKEISTNYGTISLDASNSTLTRRLQERAKYSGRIDDDSLKIQRRVETFSTRAGEMVRLLQERKNPFHRIDSEGSVDEIQDDFLQRAMSTIRYMDSCIEH